MSDLNSSTDYSSSSADSSSLGSAYQLDSWSTHRPLSYADTVQGQSLPSLLPSIIYSNVSRRNKYREQVMEEFKNNGIDSPYVSEEDDLKIAYDGGYSRQWSWPAPEASPRSRLPQNASVTKPTTKWPATTAPNSPVTSTLTTSYTITSFPQSHASFSTPAAMSQPQFSAPAEISSQYQPWSNATVVDNANLFPNDVAGFGGCSGAVVGEGATAGTVAGAGAGPGAGAGEAAVREALYREVLSLPASTLASLLQRARSQGDSAPPIEQECRFCKNNGEQVSYYTSHQLRDATGAVECPVLRAFRCQRCGASGDRAHTLKYCPYTSDQERAQATAMMRSVRAGGRRRWRAGGAGGAGVGAGGAAGELDPVWAALLLKLK